MRIFLSKFLLFVLVVLVSCKMSNNIDSIFYNGTIHSLDNQMNIFQAMAVSNGKIVALGSNEDILSNFPYKNRINLSGHHVYPGFIDPHSHFIGYSKEFFDADLKGSQSMEEIIERLMSHSEKIEAEWIVGRGWDQNLWQDKKMPCNKSLNDAFPDKPVYIKRIDSHASVANDLALKLAAIDSKTELDGGVIASENGELTGLLMERAMYLVESVMPSPPKQEIIRVMREAQENLFSVGLTSVSDAGINKDEVLLLDSLHNSGDLKIRVYAMLNPNEKNLEYFIDKGIYIRDRLTVRSIKLYADGALGSRGALLLEPYSDSKNKTGIAMNNSAFIRKICRMAYENGLQVNTHCIGDSAVRILLNIYKDFLSQDMDLRWRIEHAQVVDPDDFKMFGKYNIIPSVQAIHAISDMHWVEKRLGERIKNAYAYRTLLNQNGWIANGSDFPVEPVNPLYGFHAAFSRKDSTGYPEGGFFPDEALSREQALKAMTIWAAKANFEEEIKGSLKPGKFADFVVIKENLFTVPENEIYGLKIEKTYLNGELVFSR